MDWLTLIVIPLVIGVAGLIIEYWFIIPAREEKERRKKHEDRSIATNPQFTMPAITDSDPVEYVFDAIKQFQEIEQITQKATITINTWTTEMESVNNKIKSQEIQASPNKNEKIQALLTNLSVYINDCGNTISRANRSFPSTVRKADESMWHFLKQQDVSRTDVKEQVTIFLNKLDTIERSVLSAKNFLVTQGEELSGIPRVNQNLNVAIDDFIRVAQEFTDNIRLTTEVIWRARGVIEGLLKAKSSSR